MKFLQQIYKHRKPIDDPQHLNKQVTRLIKNKIEPLSYKHHVLKSPNVNNNHLPSSKQPSRTLPSLWRNDHKENVKPILWMKNKQQERRKHFVHLNTTTDNGKYKQLQEKVENHVFVKKVLMMEDQYATAEQCNKKQKDNICQRMWRSPLEKYISMFQMVVKPSQKVRLIEETSCEKILKQIKSFKTIKHIQCGEDSPPNINASKQKKARTEVNQFSNEMYRQNDKRLRKEIMRDIKKQYQTQGSSKIRININHHKMIQMI